MQILPRSIIEQTKTGSIFVWLFQSRRIVQIQFVASSFSLDSPPNPAQSAGQAAGEKEDVGECAGGYAAPHTPQTPTRKALRIFLSSVPVRAKRAV
jgi:hypothetical protein